MHLNSHSSIVLSQVGFIVPGRICFENFSTTIQFGERIALIGRNGVGKSVLLKYLSGNQEVTQGQIKFPSDVRIGYVAQVLSLEGISGAQSFHAAFTRALASEPNLLILDEPTNHLDARNRKELLKFIQRYTGTLVVASHDEALLATVPNRIWHIEQGEVQKFYGNYRDYKNEHARQRQLALANRLHMREARKTSVLALEAERHRTAQSKRANAHENDRMLLSAMKQKGGATQARMKGRLNKRLQATEDNLAEAFVPKERLPTFEIPVRESGCPIVCEVREGAIGYGNHSILSNIELMVNAHERVALEGDNASGKTTLLKAILADHSVHRTGSWKTIAREHIGYLDQSYRSLDNQKTVLENLKTQVPRWSDREARTHLARFLFRTHEDVACKAKDLSGGERARLCLAQLVAHPPELLILDELTNNIDLPMREYLQAVLQTFPGAMLIVSHDAAFLKALKIDRTFKLT